MQMLSPPANLSFLILRGFGLSHVVDLITDFLFLFFTAAIIVLPVLLIMEQIEGDTQFIFGGTEELRAGQRSVSASGVYILREIRLLCGRRQLGCRRSDGMLSWLMQNIFVMAIFDFELGLVVSTAFITVTELSLDNMVAIEDGGRYYDAGLVTAYEAIHIIFTLPLLSMILPMGFF
jgi:hypothetical protein